MVEPTETINDFGALPAELGEVVAEVPGPTVVVIAAIHGNEPAGVAAVQAVLAELAGGGLRRGRVVARIGHPEALRQGRRALQHDLNRFWRPGAPTTGPDAEAHAALAAWLAPHLTPGAVLVDLHTTSAGGPPFALACTPELAPALAVPLVLGLLERVPGTVVAWAAARGHSAVAVEGGRHDDPGAVATHARVLRGLLAALGCTTTAAAPPAAGPYRVVYDHPITAADRFVMDPGFASFTPVQRGQRLAHDRRGPVVAPRDGLLLMPLYQPDGTEGFFLVEALST